MRKIIFAMLFFISLTTYSYINIYPVKFEKNIKNGAYETFKLYNSTKLPVRYRIYIEENSAENSMSNWCEIYPKSITLNPLQEGEIKLFVKSPEKIEAGKYNAKLVIKEVDVPSKEKREKKKIMTILKMNLVGIVE